MKKMRWFGKFCCAFAAVTLASLSVMGCDLEVDDKDNRAALVSSSGNSGDSFLYVGLGGENTFNISSVKLGDTEQAITHATLAPSLWNAISEFETVKLPEGSSVSYTFKQADVGSDNYKTWAIAVYDNATISSANGTFLRGDDWLNKSTDAGFAAGLWSDGNVTAGGTYSNNFTVETAGKALTSSNTVVVKVEYSGSTVTITETVDGQLAYTTTGTISSSSASSSEDDNTNTDNTTTDNTNTDNTNTENENGENESSIPTETDYVVGTEDCTTSWVAGSTYTIASGATQTVYFKNYGSGAKNWNNFLLELWNTDNESAVTLRADNYGWNYGSGNTEFSYDSVDTTGSSVPSTDADWATWLTAMNGATVKLVVTYVDGTITFTATSDDVADWKQVYSFSGCTSSELYWHFNVDGSYIVVLK
ncbi:MAG: hypothetical protein IJ717_05865 [Treponema sp.]|nr:hypothetical protein [Treponema sp.]